MAKKKRKPAKPGRKQAKPQDMLADPRLREKVLHELVAGLHGQGGQDTPTARAQALLYQAFAEPSPGRQTQLAKQALQIDPDCADAYVLLAEVAGQRPKALLLYEQAVAAATRTLGPDALQQNAGQFWGILETRPYMRARLGLAHVLWVTGRREEAVQHLQEMLRLNPNDNQGIRYTLAGFLLFLDRDQELAQLLQQYPDEESATWAYTKALLAFRRQGDTAETRQLLKQAQKTNKHVPTYLLGEKSPPPEPPSSYSPGAESEALQYLGSFMAGWKFTPGAIAWLRENLSSKKPKSSEPQPKGPLSLIKNWLKERLPQDEEDVWQVDCRQFPQWMSTGHTKIRPWLVLAASQSRDLVLAFRMPEDAPTAELLWDTLVQAMQQPMAGNPHRPGEIQVRPDARWEALRPHLSEIGIELSVRDQLDEFDALFNDMTAHICGKREAGLLDAPGVTPEMVGGFYEAAARFFEQMPWKKVGYESALKVECAKFHSGPWYAVLMGQSGLNAGLALYEDLAVLRQMWEGDAGEEENARQTVGATVLFGEEFELPVADLDAAQKYGWKVARAGAYPWVFHKERGMSVRPPLAWELELMEGCLRVIPGFVNRHKQDDPTREEVTAACATGPLSMALSWVGDEEEARAGSP